MKLIEVEDLRYSYGDKQTLKGITTSISQGEKVAVIGSNGSGKSTFFLTLNGILRVEPGMLKYKGKPVQYDKKSIIELRKGIGIIFQDPDDQIVAQSVFHEIAFGVMNLERNKEYTKQKVNAIIDKMGLKDLADKAPHYLSGGEKKSVTIADILIMEPEIIIFDEPTASLDPIHIQKLEITLEELYQSGITLLISTHDMDFAYRWADRILVFHNGCILADNIPEKVFADSEMLAAANSAEPIVFKIYKSLLEYGKVSGTFIPKNVEQLITLVKG